ncbi:uncharacterized protein A4U43_UnF10180, partial [Asparagus officinalis]
IRRGFGFRAKMRKCEKNCTIIRYDQGEVGYLHKGLDLSKELFFYKLVANLNFTEWC